MLIRRMVAVLAVKVTTYTCTYRIEERLVIGDDQLETTVSVFQYGGDSLTCAGKCDLETPRCGAFCTYCRAAGLEGSKQGET